MCERAVRPVLDAVAPVVRVVHAHARLVVLEVVAPLRVARGAVQVRAPGTGRKKGGLSRAVLARVSEEEPETGKVVLHSTH